MAIPRFLLRKKKNTVIRFAVVWSFWWCFCHCLFLIGNFFMVDSPRFPKSSGIDPKKLVKFAWPYRGSYFVKKKTPSFDSPWFGLSCGGFAIVYSSLVSLLWLIHRDSRNLRELTGRKPWLFQSYIPSTHIRVTTVEPNDFKHGRCYQSGLALNTCHVFTQ